VSTATRRTGAKSPARRKDGLVRLSLGDPVELPIDAIRPAEVNSVIYRPVEHGDPAIQELANSIRERGLLQPIVVSREGYILSGHRRYMACRLLGRRVVSCQVAEISVYDPDFPRLLCEFNRQRTKSFDEVVRECLTTRAGGDPYQALVAHRKARSAVSGEFLSIEGTKDRKRISKAKMPMLNVAVQIIDAKCDYWPLSDREIHYDILNVPPLRHASKPDSRYQNNRDCYKDLCDLLTRARLAGEIPFHAIADQTRKTTVWSVDREVGGFVRRELNGFLQGYYRDLMQSQPNQIEIVGEKNTVESSIRSVAMEYCIPYTLGRGYCSLDPRHKMYERFRKSGKAKLIVLILSDFDPEGEDIAHSFARSMRDDFGVRNIVAKKVCLTYEQVLERNIPQTFDIKKSSSRYKKFARKYGDRAHELEALPPAERARLLEEAILEVMDLDAYNREVDAEREDARRIAALREKVAGALATTLGGVTPPSEEGGQP
jgi:hypothetical protein